MNLSKLILFFFYFITINGSAQYSLSGIVTEKESHKPLIGVSVKTENGKGTVTNFNGRYTIILSQGKNKISYSFVGYETKTFNININGREWKDKHFVSIRCYAISNNNTEVAEGNDQGQKENLPF